MFSHFSYQRTVPSWWKCKNHVPCGLRRISSCSPACSCLQFLLSIWLKIAATHITILKSSTPAHCLKMSGSQGPQTKGSPFVHLTRLCPLFRRGRCIPSSSCVPPKGSLLKPMVRKSLQVYIPLKYTSVKTT